MAVCCNYATDLRIYGSYASDNVCCILVGFQVLLSVTGMLVDLSVTIMKVTVSVAVMQVTVSAANIWVTIFIVIMQMGVCCNYAGGIFCSALCT